MEHLEQTVKAQAEIISQLKHELFMLRLEVDTLNLKAKLAEIDIKSIERRHENLLDFSLKSIK